MALKDEWQGEIRRRLSEVFKEDSETLAGLFFYLDEDFENGETTASVWKTLKDNLHSDNLLRSYARKLVRCTTENKDSVVSKAAVMDTLDQLVLDDLEQFHDIDDWKSDIGCKLLDVFRDDPETLHGILTCLLEKKDSPHVWNSLKSNLSSDSQFKSYATSLLQEVEESSETSFFDESFYDEYLGESQFVRQAASIDMDNWKVQIRAKLVEVFQDDPDTLTRILFYLDQEDSLNREAGIPPAWGTLKVQFYSSELFQTSAKSFAEETKEARMNKKYNKNASRFYKSMGFQDEPLSDSHGKSPELEEDVPVALPEVGFTDECKDDIRRKVCEVFKEDPETKARVLFYLDEEDKRFKDSPDIAPVWKTLQRTQFSDHFFESYAKSLAEETKQPGINEAFEKAKMTEEEPPESTSAEPQTSSKSSFFSFNKKKAAFRATQLAWTLIPKGAKNTLATRIGSKIASRFSGRLASKISTKILSTVVDDGVGAVSKGLASRALVAVAALQLTWDVFRSWRRWRKGEISSKRVAKNIIDSAVAIGAGIGGGAVGTLALGPVGSLAGGVAASLAASILIDKATIWAFGIPPDEDLENAYNFLGVEMTATDQEIQQAYRKKCLQCHPDRPEGSQEKFDRLQTHMEVIYQARGKTTNSEKKSSEKLAITDKA